MDQFGDRINNFRAMFIDHSLVRLKECFRVNMRGLLGKDLPELDTLEDYLKYYKRLDVYSKEVRAMVHCCMNDVWDGRMTSRTIESDVMEILKVEYVNLVFIKLENGQIDLVPPKTRRETGTGSVMCQRLKQTHIIDRFRCVYS